LSDEVVCAAPCLSLSASIACTASVRLHLNADCTV
jgi:hypothetical protein